MEPALHHRYILSGELSEYKLSLVIRGGRALHMGHFRVGDADGVFHRVCQRPQAGAQDQQHPGPKITQPLLQCLSALLILFHGIIHLLISF